MILFYPQAILLGDRFSPIIAAQKTGLQFEKATETGDFQERGRYRHSAQPYGSASLLPTGNDYSAVLELADTLSTHISALRECGLERALYYLGVSFDPNKDQCNLEFSPQFQRKLSESDIPLLITVTTGE